jgi:hypothetical protein
LVKTPKGGRGGGNNKSISFLDYEQALIVDFSEVRRYEFYHGKIPWFEF